MSSKKARRKQNKEQRKARSRKKRNPAKVFIAAMLGLLVLIVVGALLFGDPTASGPDGDPPWPGAVWSPEHGHWH